MNWIDEANKKLEAQRAKFQEELDNGDASKRGMSNGAKKQLKTGTHNFQKSSGKRKPNKPMTAEHQFAFSSAGGKAQKGIPKPQSKIEAKKLDVPWTCEHCGKSGRGIGNLKRYLHHTGECLTTKAFRKSTLVKFNKMLALLPETFTENKANEICNPKKYSSSLVKNLIHTSGLLECIHKGTPKSSKDRPIYKKIET